MQRLQNKCHFPEPKSACGNEPQPRGGFRFIFVSVLYYISCFFIYIYIYIFIYCTFPNSHWIDQNNKLGNSWNPYETSPISTLYPDKEVPQYLNLGSPVYPSVGPRAQEGESLYFSVWPSAPKGKPIYFNVWPRAPKGESIYLSVRSRAPKGRTYLS